MIRLNPARPSGIVITASQSVCKCDAGGTTIMVMREAA